MIILPLKACVKHDLKTSLSKWLDGYTDPNTPRNPMQHINVKTPQFTSAQCGKDLQRLAALRNCLADVIPKSHAHQLATDEFGLQDCHEYHAALLVFLERGFPSRDEQANGTLQLSYKSIYSTDAHEEIETHGSLDWERACVLWNTAALESFLASKQDSTTSDGNKQTVKHLQIAAACLQTLREDVVPGQPFGDHAGFSEASLRFWQSVVLAEAQTAAYEMVVATPSGGGEDDKAVKEQQYSLQAYLACGAAQLWNEALQHAKDPRLVSTGGQEAIRLATQCKATSMLLSCRAHYHKALASRAEADWGVEIGYLRKASELVGETVAFYRSHGGSGKSTDNGTKGRKRSTWMGRNDKNKKDNDSGTNSSSSGVGGGSLDDSQVLALQRFIEDRKARVEHENKLYYCEHIPDSVPEIRAHVLVKPAARLPETMLKPKVALFKGL